MKTIGRGKAILLLFGLVCFVFTSYAWKRLYYSTVEVVQHADLIVVGRINPDSIVLVPHKPIAGQVESWEHHCELLITEVLKGTNAGPSINISINYGVDPVVGGYVSNQFGFRNYRSGRTNYANDVVEVFDTGNSVEVWAPITGDIRTNHIWLLRRAKVGQSSGLIGVYDPQDIQPVGMRSEVLRCLSYQK
jgi:hypothetical protein